MRTPQTFEDPDYILLFRITEKVCQANFSQWLSKNWLVPSKLRKVSFRGEYHPVFSYSAATTTDYHAERGEHRIIFYTQSDWNGRSEKRLETRWSDESGSLFSAFEHVMVSASRQATVTSLKDCDMQPYSPKHLSGFTVEPIHQNANECFDEAKTKMEADIERAIRERIGGDEQNIKSKTTHYNDVKISTVLFPLWMTAFRYNKKLYHIAVNGCTGEVIGRCPKSLVKIAFLVTAVITVAAGLFFKFI